MECPKCGSPWNHLETIEEADQEKLISTCEDCGETWDAQ